MYLFLLVWEAFGVGCYVVSHARSLIPHSGSHSSTTDLEQKVILLGGSLPLPDLVAQDVDSFRVEHIRKGLGSMPGKPQTSWLLLALFPGKNASLTFLLA